MTLDLSKYFRVISKEPSIKDEDPNERIQKEGAHMGYKGPSYIVVDNDEKSWYDRHKGYSQKG